MPKEVALPEGASKRVLRTTLREGAYTGASVSISELYAVPFAKEIGTAPFGIGALSALTGIASPLAQLYGTRLLQRRSRKRITLRFMLLQTLLWIPIVLLALAVQKHWLSASAPLLFILLSTLLIIAANIYFPAWFSWIGDLVPEQERGRYFSKRGRIIGFIGLVIVLGGAFLIDFFKTRGWLLLGFACLFALAALLRFFAMTEIKKIPERQQYVTSRDYFSFFAFLRRMDNFGRFAVYIAFFNGAVMFASPFFAIYMLQELNFSYVTLMLVTLSSTLFYLLFTPAAGRFSDKYGNRRLLHISNVLFILSPLCWILIQNPLLLIIVPQLVAGIANAAFGMGSTNFIYDAVQPKHRALCVTYTNLLAGAGTFIGALLGGFVVETAHPSNLSPFFFLFGMAALLRFLAGFIFLPRIHEVKRTSPLPSFSLNLFHPLHSLNNDFTWMKRVLKEG